MDADESPRAVYVVLATYNERNNIERLLNELLALPLDARVVVVDDNSPDGTAAAVSALAGQFPGRIDLISRPGKMGYGSAFVAGFRRALELGATQIVSMDADFSHDPHSVPDLVAALGPADLAIGSRYVGGIRILNWSLRRLLLSSFANFYVNLILGFRVQDSTSGFRAYQAGVLRAIPFGRIQSRGYAFLVELLASVKARGYRVTECPIVYAERRAGQSKMSQGVILEAIGRPWLILLRRLLGR